MKTESEIKAFLKESLSRLLNIKVDQIEEDVPLDAHYGLKSMDSMSLGAKLEDWLEVELDVEFLFEYRTIAELAKNAAKMNEGY